MNHPLFFNAKFKYEQKNYNKAKKSCFFLKKNFNFKVHLNDEVLVYS